MKIKNLLSLSLFSLCTVAAFAQTPVLIKDVDPFGYGNPKNFCSANGTLYFVALNTFEGYELWKSDGTDAGTVLVKDIYPGTQRSDIGAIVAYNGKAYFKANDGTNGYELWVSDGTDAGTHMVKNIGTADNSLDPSEFYVFNGALYFTARVNGTGITLWKTDGTEAGTVQLKTLYTSANASNASYFATMNNHLYFFSSENPLMSTDLWKSDGTEAGTSIIKNYGGLTGALYVDGNRMFFGFNGEGANALNRGLYVSDGTEAGTVKVKDINVGNLAFFPVNGTGLVKKGKFIFIADDGVHGDELWTSDGTEAGTQLLKDITVGIESGVTVQTYLTQGNGSQFFFVAKETGSSVREIWTSDGTEAGTHLLDTPGAGSEYPANLYAYNGYLFYRARSTGGAHGDELWRTDGTQAGTKMVADLWVGPTGSSPANLYGANNMLYFNGNNGTVGFELYGLAVSPLNTGVSSIVKNEISVYPNPASGRIYIPFLESSVITPLPSAPPPARAGLRDRSTIHDTRYSIHDTNGRLVQEGSLTESIDISNLEKGIYILKVAEGVARFVKN